MVLPESEAEVNRLSALKDLRLLDTPPSESFDRLTRMASRLFDLPIAAVSLTDSDRQWFKSRVGVEHWSMPRDKAPCAAVAMSRQVLVIEDVLDDPRYRDSSLAQHGIRFYAGAPLTTTDGFGLGAICVLGTEPRKASPSELDSLQDLASMVMAQIELQHAFGHIDPISGLPNRRQFVEDLDDLARDHAGEPRLAVLFDLIGVDTLNHAARVMGSAAIDEVLKSAVRSLRNLVGPDHDLYHVGHAQLACLAPAGFDEAGYREHLSAKASQFRRIAGQALIGTPAVGVAPFSLGKLPPSDVLRIAQGAAQDARSACTLVAFHSANQDSAFQRRFKLRRDFEQAIESRENLRLVYQPRIDAASGRCMGVEALLRWTHPTLGPVSPSEFIPLIEQSALARPMTAWVIDTAVQQLARWHAIGMDLQVSVNISAANLRDPEFAASVSRVLDHRGVPAGSLELEITETAIMTNAELALGQLETLAAAGVRLAIDDFGTGYSSLSYLQRLPVHVVKIDRSFVGNLDTDPRQRSFVAMMATLSKHLGYRTVAEGAETATVVEHLREAGCDEIQGFFFARPMMPDDVKPWLVANDRDRGFPLNGRGPERAGEWRSPTAGNGFVQAIAPPPAVFSHAAPQALASSRTRRM